ncbi:putative 3-oxoacyl-reductase [Microdochium trichocladiopsis]|uniref:3-oxoacyl-reductase n=1 Tax=Microdochium trichocladiopsis TaxID=1682393 RepID=A0A9P8YB40_9PEZI|nr:putative 3-oxoacyl-reductase [Microdochium trichocladiopsis]KAH7034794.1 putative 3-oxoacyl-reductase [Microdochium trichocladiopsis]
MSAIHRFPIPTKIYHDNAYPTISPTRPENSAKGKTVVVTGGGTGIGAETARSFAAAGASRILLVGRRLEPLQATKTSIEAEFPSASVTTFSADVTDKGQVDAAFDTFASQNDNVKIDVLISNAGVAGPLEGVAAVDPTAFLSGIHANVAGALHVAQAFLRHANPSGAVVVNVSSHAAHMNFGDAFASYSVGKLAAYRVWDTVGFNHAHVRVYHLQPGVVNTDLNKSVGGVEALGFEDHVSLPAGTILWLASPEAAFLKGKYLWSNWDMDELKTRAEEIAAGQEFNIQLVGWPFNKEFQGLHELADSANNAA